MEMGIHMGLVAQIIDDPLIYTHSIKFRSKNLSWKINRLLNCASNSLRGRSLQGRKCAPILRRNVYAQKINCFFLYFEGVLFGFLLLLPINRIIPNDGIILRIFIIVFILCASVFVVVRFVKSIVTHVFIWIFCVFILYIIPTLIPSMARHDVIKHRDYKPALIIGPDSAKNR